MSHHDQPSWRPVLFSLPDGVLEPLPPKQYDVPGLVHVTFVGAILIVNTMRKKDVDGGTGWIAHISDSEFVYRCQVVLEGAGRAVEEMETPEEFRLRAIIMALASGFRLPAAE